MLHVNYNYLATNFYKKSILLNRLDTRPCTVYFIYDTGL